MCHIIRHMELYHVSYNIISDKYNKPYQTMVCIDIMYVFIYIYEMQTQVHAYIGFKASNHEAGIQSEKK